VLEYCLRSYRVQFPHKGVMAFLASILGPMVRIMKENLWRDIIQGKENTRSLMEVYTPENGSKDNTMVNEVLLCFVSAFGWIHAHSAFLSGYGQCTWSDGRAYIGMWQMGRAHGHGKEINPDGSIRHDGLWSSDMPVKNKK
jgi:MORN repeat